MTAEALPFAAVLPLSGAAVLLVVKGPVWLRRTIALGTLAAVLALGAALLAATADGTVLAHGVGLWPGGVAIPFAADSLSALLLTATALLTLVCTAFGMVVGADARRYFAPMVLVLYAGVGGALLTGDLFNLFVFVEVMLLPAYVLMSMYGGSEGIRAGRIYIIVNLLASAVFLAGVAFLYGVAGRVNIASLAGAASEDTAVALGAGVILIALSLKAGIVPMHGWLPQTYPMTSPTISAIFAGLHTKVAVYAIYRVYAVVYDGDARYLGVAMAVMCLTMLVGAFGALGEETMRGNLCYTMVSGIGYILLGVALFGPLGLTAGIFYLVHHMVAMGALFLTAGAVEHRYGSQRLADLGGIARTEPLIAFAFVGGALALIGMPPFSGFTGKFLLLQASFAEGEYLVGFVVVAASLVTLLAMMKIWNGAFWGPPVAAWTMVGAPAQADAVAEADEVESDVATRRRVHAKAAPPLTAIRPAMAAPAVLLAVTSLALGIGSEGLLVLSQQAAAGLLEPSTYVEAVLNP